MVSGSDFQGKIALVTGASSGIGQSIARLLVREGARVAAAARRIERLEELGAEISYPGGALFPVQMDVCSVASIEAARVTIEAELGPVEIVINNAGVVHQGKAAQIGEVEFDRVFSTNIRGSFFVAQIFARRMIDLGIAGRIVNTASIAGLVSMPQLSVYGMSKAAVVHMTKVLANEWGRHGISVNAVAPGYIATELNDEFFASESGQKLVGTLPKRRIGRTEDLFGALLMLASPTAGRFMNGAIVTVDDGYSVK